MEDAVAFAVTPLYATSPCSCRPGRDRDAVPGLRLSARRCPGLPSVRCAIPAGTWSLLITEADTANCVDIGWARCAPDGVRQGGPARRPSFMPPGAPTRAARAGVPPVRAGGCRRGPEDQLVVP